MRGPNQSIVKGARRLRRTATDAETKLWFALRDRRLAGFKFVRQKPIPPFVADFVCRDQKLVIEVDGGQHADNRKTPGAMHSCVPTAIAFCDSGITMYWLTSMVY